jgi:hypothetical protein
LNVCVNAAQAPRAKRKRLRAKGNQGISGRLNLSRHVFLQFAFSLALSSIEC